MIYAVVCRFNKEFEQQIVNLWDTLDKLGYSSYHKHGLHFPHVTLLATSNQIVTSLDVSRINKFQITFDKPTRFEGTDTLTLQTSNQTLIRLRDHLLIENGLIDMNSTVHPYVPHLTLTNHQGDDNTRLVENYIDNHPLDYNATVVCLSVLGFSEHENTQIMTEFPLGR
jgi:2'-5' RNA ligase